MSLFFRQLHKASFHSSRLVTSEWTKASLRRMKKIELIQLAKENNLGVSGTKNEIIIDLLTRQTAKIVGSTTPASLHHTTEETVNQTTDDQTTHSKEDTVNQDWVNAFDMKVAQRRSSRKPFLPQTESRESKPHPMNDAFRKTVSNHAFVTQTVEESEEKEASEKKEGLDDGLDGMDPRWVEAFELKVSSRDTRQKTQDNVSPINTLDSVTAEKDTLETPNSKTPHNSSPINTLDPVTVETRETKNQWASAMIGSSMLIWYFGGQEGFNKIWQFFAS
ncbi:hypothetical protein BD560DRAFT_457169 [Blakeslea trispora]|nr:hypothetical protein BD560DRAFT_457169 [Blakeslea trispora]